MSIITGIPSINFKWRVLCLMMSIVISIVTLPPKAAIVINVNSLILRLCLIARSLSDTVKTNAKILIIMR